MKQQVRPGDSHKSFIWVSLLLCLVLISPEVFSDQVNLPCNEIENDRERLNCYDRQSVKKNILPEIRSHADDSLLSERLAKEHSSNYNEFAITSHKPNYLLPLTYNNNPNEGLYKRLVPDEKIATDHDKHELKFQISFKIPLFEKFLYKNGNLWFGYSQVAFWQMYNLDSSAPFRETNYEPELMWANKTNFEMFGFTNSFIILSFNHQSNGQEQPLSRSWNRITAQFILEKNHIVLTFKPWYRIPEDDNTDDNPDIDKYLGYGEFTALFKYKGHLSNVMLRNNMRAHDNRSTVELTYTFKINERLKGVAQYFNGYGESLIDYNHRSQRFGIGVMLTDWL